MKRANGSVRRIEKSLDDKTCSWVLDKLNEPHKGAEWPLDLVGELFTGNSASVEWKTYRYHGTGQGSYVHYYDKGFVRGLITPMAGHDSWQIIRKYWDFTTKELTYDDFRRLFYKEAYDHYLNFNIASRELLFPDFPNPVMREQNLLVFDKQNQFYVGLESEAHYRRFCDKHYHILASIGKAYHKQYFPICHFVSIPKIVCGAE